MSPSINKVAHQSLKGKGSILTDRGPIVSDVPHLENDYLSSQDEMRRQCQYFLSMTMTSMILLLL